MLVGVEHARTARAAVEAEVQAAFLVLRQQVSYSLLAGGAAVLSEDLGEGLERVGERLDGVLLQARTLLAVLLDAARELHLGTAGASHEPTVLGRGEREYCCTAKANKAEQFFASHTMTVSSFTQEASQILNSLTIWSPGAGF